jgi:dephospho-CoA kinase
MNGSPGSGKTEVANELVSFYQNICIIDADCFREGFGYNGTNHISSSQVHLGWWRMCLKE